MYNPRTIHSLHDACKKGDYEEFKKYSKLANNEEKEHFTLRGLIDLKFDESNSIPLEEVESVEEICKRFKINPNFK